MKRSIRIALLFSAVVQYVGYYHIQHLASQTPTVVEIIYGGVLYDC